MDLPSHHKGKAISTSTPSFSFRYNAEDEEVEQVYTPASEPETQKIEEHLLSSSISNGKEDARSKDSSPVLHKANKRSGSLEDGGSPEPWRLFTEIKGRITKTVEEKIEEIKNDRIKSRKKKKLLNTSSLSDSEERSEASSSLKDTSDKSTSDRQKDTVADSDLGDISDTSLTPDRATPIVTEVDISETTPSKENTLHQHVNTPKKSAFFPPESPTLEKGFHFSHKKPKAKSRGKLEFGVEAIEEVKGKEEGRSVQMKSSSGEGMKNSTTMPAISVRAAAYFALLGVLYAFLNIPQFLFGLILGVFLSFEFSVWAETCFQWMSRSQSNDSSNHNSSLFLNNDIYAPSSSLSYEGWINEFCYEYQPEIYHVRQTETVYIRLEGSVLKLASPRQKISKRAIWNEPTYKLRFDRERTYDISGCEVLLLPDKLAHKRIWSKKYPICIILKHDSHLGTRYRERGTPSLEFVSYKGHSSKKLEDTNKETNTEENVDNQQEEEVKREPMPSDDEGEIIFYSEDEDDDDGLSSDYVKIPSSIINKSNIYLFARTDREKDLWFRRLLAAVKNKSHSNSVMTDESYSGQEFMDKDQIENHAELCYSSISKLLGRKISYQSPDESIEISEEEDEGMTWFNVFLARILFDPMHDPYWIKQIQEKIQKKLSAIKVPPFMEELLVSQVELSDSIPSISRSGLPQLTEDGIWVDLDIAYNGTFIMAIDTKINIIKLKNSKLDEALSRLERAESPESQEKSIYKAAIFDSEVEDTAESSDDEVDPEDPHGKSSNSRNTSHKVLQMVDKIASSKYFQQVTDNKYIKRALEGVSNTTISLVVEVKSLVGTVVLNFPPPPSDRLWYGFRPNTKLTISAKPRVGQRGINMAYITNYIEKKLLREFEKLLVMPNMDDLILPVMNKTKPI